MAVADLPIRYTPVSPLTDGQPAPAPPILTITVYGNPAPQGSKRAIPIRKGPKGAQVLTGKFAMVESSKERVRDWRADVKEAAEKAIADRRGSMFPLGGALLADMVFTAARPRTHYRTGRNAHLLKGTAPIRPTSKPDLGKLARSTEDALKTAGVYLDDALLVEYGRLAKVYVGEDRDALTSPGALIRVWTINPEGLPS